MSTRPAIRQTLSPSSAGLEVTPVPAAGAWLVLWALCGVYILNFLDRQLVGTLAKPIEETLHLSDGQLGFLSGLFFACFYCFIAIPVGWLADRTSRVMVLSAACGIWSLATAGCGLAMSYAQLVSARMLVGFGEAGGVPPSYALISDYFPSARRGTALGIYNTGPALGAALGVAFGSAIAARFNWRYAFVSIGIAGVLAALAIPLFVREPVRGAQDTRPAQSAPASGFWETVRMFCSRPVLLLAAFGSGAAQMITYGLGNFTVLYLEREKGMTLGQVGVYYALVIAVGMCGSMLASGVLIDRLTRHSRAAYGTLPGLSLLLAIPFYLGFLWAPSWPLALGLLLGVYFLNYFYLSAAVALVQEEVPPQQRVMSGALLLVMNFIGLGLGPTYVGMASDLLRAAHPAHSLQIALFSLTVFYVIASGLFLRLAHKLRGPKGAQGRGSIQTPVISGAQ